MSRYVVRGWRMSDPSLTVELGSFWWLWRARSAARRWRHKGHGHYAYIRDARGALA